MPMKIGYIRVSTQEQNTVRQEDLMERLGVELVYMDKLSGKARDRPALQTMMDFVRAGDTVVVESISRFARNTVDSLTTIRRLKEAGCECFFQKENIMTFDSKGELLITIMSSLVQEESRSISENVTWGQRKRFADGKVSIPYGQFLGYRKGADGLPEIVPEEAEIVRHIYCEFLQGKSTNAIASILTEEGIPTPGKKTVWQRATVESILHNEKYKGSALLQNDMLPLDETVKKTNSLKIKGEHYYAAKAKTGNRKEGKDCQEISGRRSKHKHSGSRGRRGSGNASRLGHAV